MQQLILFLMLTFFCLGIFVEISYQIFEIKAYIMKFLCKSLSNASYKKTQVGTSICFLAANESKRRTARKKAVVLQSFSTMSTVARPSLNPLLSPSALEIDKIPTIKYQDRDKIKVSLIEDKQNNSNMVYKATNSG